MSHDGAPGGNGFIHNAAEARELGAEADGLRDRHS